MEILTDEAIAALVAEPKGPAPDVELQPSGGGQLRAAISIRGSAGSRFTLHFRQSLSRQHDFSIVLAYHSDESRTQLRLRRYNGSTHRHTNRLDGEQLPKQCHIHRMTERYQRRHVVKPSISVDGQAEPTDLYEDLQGAWRLCLAECGFDSPAALPAIVPRQEER